MKTAQGVELSGKVAKTLDDIAAKARLVDQLAAEVASASREQTQGINQINTAVAQMDKVTQSNAASAEESAAAAEELNAQAETMRCSVAELLHLVRGSANHESDSPAKPEIDFSSALPARTETRIISNHHPRPSRGDGQAAPVGAARQAIPLDDDFRDS